MKIDKLVRYAAGLGLAGALCFACTGTLQVDDPPDGPEIDAGVDANLEPATPREYFDQKVAPIIAAQCGCHDNVETRQAPIFTGADYTESYNYLKEGYPDTGLIRATPAESIFYTEPQQPHYGGEWKDGQAAYVSEWITWEYQDYSSPPPTARALFDDYVYTAIEMKCGCHNGAAPIFRGNTPDATYNYLKENYPNGPLLQSTPANSSFYSIAYQQTHQAQQWSPDEATNIANWITTEYAEYSAAQ